MEIPLVSVCIPTFNGAKFLREALNSISTQSYKNIELIVSDDNSQDNTLELIESYKSSSEFSIQIFNNNPAGIGANWNNCIKKASGKYIKFLFQDDILLPDCIEKMVKVLEEESDIELVTSKRDFLIDDIKKEISDDWIYKYDDLQKNLSFPIKDNFIVLTNSFFKDPAFLLPPLNKIGEPSCTMFTRNLVEKIGYFRADLHQILDFEFYYRALRITNIAIINEKLVLFRLHSKQETFRNKILQRQDVEAYDLILLKNYIFYLSWTERGKLIRRIYRNFLKKYLIIFL